MITPRENLLRSLRREGFDTVPLSPGGFCPSQLDAFEARFGHRDVVGTEMAVATNAWAAVATSNFCGPQFRGMWDDVTWHQRLTKAIRAQPLPILKP